MLRRCRPLLGTFVEVTADHDAAIDAGFAAVERVHRLMSAHEPDSDISRINRFSHVQPVQVDGWTALVVERALFWSKRSEGAFDAVRAGKAALERGLLPRHRDQPAPVGAHWTWLETQGRSVRLLKPGCLDVGGIAKGFAVDRAIEALRHAGCQRGLVNAGGDLRGFGNEPWPVDVAHPEDRRPLAAIDLDNAALATSAGLPGDDGSLSFDHLQGGDSSWISVSVLARTACDADALTKIVWNLSDEAGPLLADVNAEAFAVTTGGEIRTIGELTAVPE
jgi:thiamine biosynthesis lipoprotein